MAKKKFQFHPWPAEIFGKNRKMRFLGKIKCCLCFKKKQAKKLIFDPKIALRVELSDPARNHQFRVDFLNARL